MGSLKHLGERSENLGYEVREVCPTKPSRDVQLLQNTLTVKRELEDEAVPEWRIKYLDYKASSFAALLQPMR